MLFQGPNKNACVNRSPKMDIYRGRVGTSRGGPTPPSGKVPHPTPPGASPPRPLRPGQVAGAQGGARALFGGDFGRSSLGREKGWASVSWRSSGWRPVVFYYHWEHRAIRVIIISRAALDGFERALSCPERGSNHPPSGPSSSSSEEGGRGREGQGVRYPSGMLRVGRQRVQRQRVLERDEQWVGHAALLSCSFWTGTGWGCSPEGVGRGCRSDRGGPTWWKR